MAANPKAAGRQPKQMRQGKNDLRQQKRKRDQDDLQKLEEAVEEMVDTPEHVFQVSSRFANVY